MRLSKPGSAAWCLYALPLDFIYMRTTEQVHVRAPFITGEILLTEAEKPNQTSLDLI